MVWSAGPGRSSTWFNRRWLEFRGSTMGEELGLGWVDGVHGDDRARCLEAYSDAFERREPFSIEYRLRGADGEFRWVIDHGSPWTTDDGHFAGYVGSCVDVDETRAALEEFRIRERQMAMVADLGRYALEVEDEQDLLDVAVKLVADGLRVSLTAVLRLTDDPDWLQIEAGTGWDETKLGTLRVRADPTTMAGYVLATDGPVVCEDLPSEARFQGGPGLRAHDVTSALSAVIRVPGRRYGVLGAYSPEPRAFGEDDVVFARNVANLIGAWVARRAVEEALQESEAEARLAFAAGRMGSWRWDPAIGEVRWSPEMAAVYGIEPGSFQGTFSSFLDHVYPDDRPQVISAVEAATTAEEPFSMEHRVVLPGGRLMWLDGRGAPVRGADGSITGWIGVGIDVTERKLVEDELRNRQLEVRLALAAGRMGVWRWNARTGHGMWSPELEDLVGIDRGSYDGSWESFIAPILASDGPLLREVVSAAAERGTEFAVGYRIRRPDGGTRWIETRGRPLGDGEWIGVSIDVTDRRGAEEALRDANERLEETVARLDTLLAAAPLGFAFYDQDFRYVRVNQVLADMIGLPVEDHLGHRISELLPGFGPEVENVLRTVKETGLPVSDIEVTGQTPAQPGVERHWLANYYPVQAPDGSLLGFGSMVVEITERKRQERAARLMAAVSELLADSPDLDAVLPRAAALMVPELADSCALYLLPRTDVARRVAIVHAEPELAEKLLDADRRWPLDVSRMLASSARLRSGKPVMVTNVTEEMRTSFAQHPDQLELAHELAVRSSITAPLHVGDDVVGLLFLDYTARSGRVHQPDDVELVGALAERIVLVLERSYLMSEAERANARLDLLAEVSELLTVGLDTRARLDAVTDVVLPTFADTCVAYLVGPEGLEVTAGKIADDRGSEGRGTTSIPELADCPAVPVDSVGPIALAFRSREPVLVSDVSPELAALLNPAGPEAEPDFDVRSALVVPLLADDEPLGVLMFGYRAAGRRYAVDDLALAREIARRVAPAVEDALRFERELATAEALQRSLLPERLPVLQDADVAARYVPGGVGLKVGGDWYDAVPLRDGRVMLVIGDVVGHGVRAAASMGKVRNVLQYSALDGLAPAAILQRLNAYFCALTDSDMATLFVAEYDPVSRKIRYANAGHPPAFLRLPDGTVEILDGGRSMPLCASDQSQYHEAQHDLRAGSTLVLYTDGLIERRRESLDVGLGRLRESLRSAPSNVEEVADTLLRDLLDQGAPQDDVALLCIATVAAAEELRLRLPAAPRQLAHMRNAVKGWLARAGASDKDIGEITVAVNEVVANAIEHAYGLVDADFLISARQVGAQIEFEIQDFGRWRNRRGGGDRGRGLDLARALMDSVDIHPGTDGTTVHLSRRLERETGEQ